MGFSSLVNNPATYNSTLTDLLLEAGAILYVKTNVPTAMMIAESVNNVFGRTVNPRNRNLTSGGSSGGESALIAFGGSRLGVGTDIGKSSQHQPIWYPFLIIFLQEDHSESQPHAQESSLSDHPPADSPTFRPALVSQAKKP